MLQKMREAMASSPGCLPASATVAAGAIRDVARMADVPVQPTPQSPPPSPDAVPEPEPVPPEPEPEPV